MTPFWSLTPKRCRFGFFYFFYTLYKYLYYYYIYNRLSIIIAFLKPLKSLIVTDLVDYRFLITDYKIGYRLRVGWMNTPSLYNC